MRRPGEAAKLGNAEELRVRSTGNRVATTPSLSVMAGEAGSASVIARERSSNFTNSGRKPSPRWAAIWCKARKDIIGQTPVVFSGSVTMGARPRE
jgi:hypothetical protein